MRMLMRIEMGRRQPRIQCPPHLRRQLLVNAIRPSMTARVNCATVMGKRSLTTSTRCTPISSEGFSRASRTASRTPRRRS